CHRLPLDLVAAAPFDRAGDAGAHPEMIVGRVDDGRGGLSGIVALGDLDFQHAVSDDAGTTREDASTPRRVPRRGPRAEDAEPQSRNPTGFFLLSSASSVVDSSYSDALVARNTERQRSRDST